MMMIMITNSLVGVTKTTNSFLTSGIPNIKDELAVVGVKVKRMNLSTNSSCKSNKLVSLDSEKF
jgi:hypothetical protein